MSVLMNNPGLKQYIMAKKAISPNMTIVQMATHIRSMPQYKKLKYKSLHKKISRLFKRGTTKRKQRTVQKPVRTPQNIKTVKNLIKKHKQTRQSSTRNIEKAMNQKGIEISRRSIQRIIKIDLNGQHRKKRKTQKLKPEHLESRVKTAKYLRSKYGVTESSDKFGWHLIINTDFSGYVRCIRKTNTQNDGVWMFPGDDENILDKGHEKYSPGCMLFGGITAEGLVPRNNPFYFDEWLKKYCKKIGKAKATLDNKIYAHFISKVFVPIMEKDLAMDLDEYIWQDDGDKKHRTKHVRETLDGIFAKRVNPDHQSDKMADVWPIENAWGSIYAKLEGKEFKNLRSLKRAINKVWKEMNAEICKKMMYSIPHRLKAVIDRNGQQIHKSDYTTQ